MGLDEALDHPGDAVGERVTDVCDHGRPDHQEMLRRLLDALGMYSGARPETPQAVFEECLAECRRLSGTGHVYKPPVGSCATCGEPPGHPDHVEAPPWMRR